MAYLDDIRLMAYVDGELHAADAMEVEQALAEDLELRERVRCLRESNALLGEAFDDAMLGEMPELRAFAATKHKPGLWALLSQWFGADQGLQWQPVAVCALLLVVVSGSGGYWLSSERQLVGYRQAAVLAPADSQALERVLHQALETQLSGKSMEWHNDRTGQGGVITPVRTFKTERGRYCREFKDDRQMLAGAREQRGVACRSSDGEWQVQARYFL